MHSGLVLTLSPDYTACTSLSSPACWWWTWASGLFLLWQLQLGSYSVFCCYCCCFFSWLCYLLRFQNSPQTHRWEGFLVFGNFSSFMTLSPGRVSIPNSFVSLFIFYILSYLLSKTMGCLSGCPMSSTSVLKLFCGICSVFKCLSMNLWGRKWSPHPIPPS